jgi:tetratricopeptide (TPR) repeat protein
VTIRPMITRWVPPGLCVAGLLLISGCGDGSEALEKGIALLQEGRSDAAVPALERAARRAPENATAHCNLGIAYAAQKNTARATAALRRAAELAQDDPRPLELLGQMFAAQEQWEEARNVLAEAQDRARSSARILAARGMVEFGAGQTARAQDLFQRCLRIEPGYPPALYNMAQVFQEYPDGDTTAIEYLERYLGSGLVDKKHSEAARDQMLALRKKLAGPEGAGPSPAEPLLAAALEAVEAQNFTLALIRLKDAVRSDPAFSDAQWELARLYDLYLEDPETAMGLYESFVTRFPGDERVSKARERQVALAQPRRPALADVVGSAAADSGLAKATYEAALEHHRNHDWDAAIDAYRQVLAHDAQHALAAINLGQVYKATDDLDGAHEALEYAYRIKPDMPDSGYYLAQIYRAMGQRPEAEVLAQSVAAKHPQYARIYYLLGLLSRDAQNPEKAREHFKKFIELAPANDARAARVREWLATQ